MAIIKQTERTRTLARDLYHAWHLHPEAPWLGRVESWAVLDYLVELLGLDPDECTIRLGSGGESA